jgi:hypothetical protein
VNRLVDRHVAPIRIEYDLDRTDLEQEEFAAGVWRDIEVDVESIFDEEAQRIIKKEKTRQVEEMQVRQAGQSALVSRGYKMEQIETIMKDLYGGAEDFIGDPQNEDHLRWWLGCASSYPARDSSAARAAAINAKLLFAQRTLMEKQRKHAAYAGLIQSLRGGGRKAAAGATPMDLS